jgi:hypothetical protein
MYVFDVISGGNHRRRQFLIKEKIIVCDIPIAKYH